MDIRPSPIAGTWYPDNPKSLAKTLDQYLEAAPPWSIPGFRLGIVVPHAGLRYSGPVAAQAFGSLRGLSPDVIAVVGPMHHSHSGALFTTGHEAYATPLGIVKVDRDATSAVDHLVASSLGYGLTRTWRDPEHSIEIELPFLQRVLGEFSLLPIMVGDQERVVAEALGHALAGVLRGRRALLVASSDLSHFRPAATALELDGELLRRVEALDPVGVLEAEEDGVGFACGRGAIAAVLWATLDLGANHGTVLGQATSGDATGDYSSVVGYGAAAIWRESSD